MNIKSLLLGSAASIVVMSSAYAADAIVAPEPESVEYVRVCDAYGAGYFTSLVQRHASKYPATPVMT